MSNDLGDSVIAWNISGSGFICLYLYMEAACDVIQYCHYICTEVCLQPGRGFHDPQILLVWDKKTHWFWYLDVVDRWLYRLGADEVEEGLCLSGGSLLCLLLTMIVSNKLTRLEIYCLYSRNEKNAYISKGACRGWSPFLHVHVFITDCCFRMLLASLNWWL